METDNNYELAHQLIVKDLGIAQDDVSFSRLDKLQLWLAREIRALLDQDFQRLMNILYRIDINESKTKLALSSDNPANAIAALIIERELQKVESRKKYKDRH